MAFTGVVGATLGSELQELLMSEGIVPGAPESYQLCKTLYLWHPLGSKLVDTPIALALSQRREITVSDAPEDTADAAFNAEWEAMRCDEYIASVKRTSRIYGVASIALIEEGGNPSDPIDYATLREKNVRFIIFDPLNTAGSLTLSQDPGSFEFQNPVEIRVAGEVYHSSRALSVLNETSIYLAWTRSAFGYVGRSVYQRALFPLKSFVNTMVTDDLVALKSGVLIAKISQQASIIDSAMAAVQGFKRNLVREAQNFNVISIAPEEEIESLNLQNIDGAFGMARTNILKNIATAASMPAKLLENEAFIEGFGEGSEDAKAVAAFGEAFRREMQPIYDFMDRAIQARAWTPAFFESLQARFPEEYGNAKYETVLVQWQNSFVATWPPLIREPESESVKTEDVKLKAMIAIAEVLLPELDPDNKARLVDWLAQNTNENRRLFPNPLELDIEALRDYVPPQPVAAAPDKEPSEPKPFSRES